MAKIAIDPRTIAVRCDDGVLREAAKVELVDAGGNVLGTVGPESGVLSFTGHGHRLHAVSVGRCITEAEYNPANYPRTLPESLW